jgi:hypothetical protein
MQALMPSHFHIIDQATGNSEQAIEIREIKTHWFLDWTTLMSEGRAKGFYEGTFTMVLAYN